MCWTNFRNTIAHAKKDIPVFKIAKVNSEDNEIHPYFRDFPIMIYKENTLYNNGFPFELHNFEGKYCVEKAMHSYSIESLRIGTCRYDIEVVTYKTTPDVYDVIARPQKYNINICAIMLCTIPKGTRYAINSMGEIVSDFIKVEKIIKTPFTLNKDNTTSVRSVDKVNKALDNWEKGKL